MNHSMWVYDYINGSDINASDIKLLGDQLLHPQPLALWSAACKHDLIMTAWRAGFLAYWEIDFNNIKEEEELN